MVEVYESPVLEPGVYQKNPDKTTWTAPGYMDLPKGHESYARFGGRAYLPQAHGWPTNQMAYVDSSNDWYLTLEYGHPTSPGEGYPKFTIPLPGHVRAGSSSSQKGIPKPCDFENISWEYEHENCFENTLTRVTGGFARSYQYYEELGINQQP